MIVRRITIIVLALNGAIGFVNSIGANEVWGVEMHGGISNTVDRVNDAAQSISSGPSGAFDAVVGLTLAAITLVVDLIQLPLALPTLMSNLGIPSEIIAFVIGPLYLVVAFDIVAIMRGDSGI